jgi:hypothetical protein
MLRKGTGTGTSGGSAQPEASPKPLSTAPPTTTGTDSLFVGLSLGNFKPSRVAASLYPGHISSSFSASPYNAKGFAAPRDEIAKNVKAAFQGEHKKSGVYKLLRVFSFLAHLSIAISLWVYWFKVSASDKAPR